MASKIKKLFITGTLVSSLFMAISACDIIQIRDSSFESPSFDSSSEFFDENSSDNPLSSDDSSESSSSSSSSNSGSSENSSSSEIPASSSSSSSSSQPVVVTLDYITVDNNKQSYEYGEELDIVVTAHYSDGTSTTITNYQLIGFNSTVPGEQNISINYEGKSCNFSTVICEPALVNITAVSNKESYEYGELLDVTVIARYADETTVEITNYTVEGYNSQIPGVQTLTFSYEDKECTLKVSVNERKNLFPAEKMSSYLQTEGIKTTIPSPIGYEEWTDSVAPEQDGSKYFITTTKDEGTVGTDSIADQYAALLENDSWKITKENNNYTAVKDEGDVALTFSTKSKTFSLRVESYAEFPTTKYVGSLIRTKTAIKDGDIVVLGSNSKEYVVSGFNSANLNTTECAVDGNNLDNVSKSAWRFTINKVGDNYTFTDINGRKLGAKGLGQLAWDEGSTEWSFVLTTRSSIIVNTNENYGRLCYDSNSGLITTYKDNSGDNLSYPQIFKISKTDIIYPESISLDGNDTVKAGKTHSLTISYLPEGTNAFSEVEWSSSDEMVATVEDGVIKGISAGTATITARTKAKRNYIEATFEVEISESALDSWTIMVYMCGADLESDNGLASADIAEMLKVSNKPDDVNILIETGGSTSWKRYGISSSRLSRYHIENSSLVLDDLLTKENMGKQSVFESFLNWGLQDFPAYKTGVVLWNHGGALDGVCFDDTVGSDSLKNSETSKAFKNVFEAHGISKLEFIAYDACVMQVQDIAEFNSHYFNYMIGSEELESGYGFVYNEWVDDVYTGKDTPTILKANVDSFIKSTGTSSDQTLSYLDLTKFEDYYNKFEAMAEAIKTTAKNNFSSFKSIIKKVKDYGDYNYGWYSQNGLDAYGTIDGLDFLNKLGEDSKFTSFKTQIDAAKEAYKQVIGYSKCGSKAGASNGMSIIAPISIGYSASETSFINWRSIFK